MTVGECETGFVNATSTGRRNHPCFRCRIGGAIRRRLADDVAHLDAAQMLRDYMRLIHRFEGESPEDCW